LFPRVGFVVTNFQTSSRAVARFYDKRGTAGTEGHLKRRLFGGMLCKAAALPSPAR
jgi:hypothetical protein